MYTKCLRLFITQTREDDTNTRTDYFYLRKHEKMTQTLEITGQQKHLTTAISDQVQAENFRRASSTWPAQGSTPCPVHVGMQSSQIDSGEAEPT